MGKIWPDEDKEYLKEAYTKYNLSIKEIAEALKRTPGSVKAKIVKLELKRPKEDIPEGYKRCPRCKEILPINRFGKKNQNKNTIDSYCLQCKNDMFKERKVKKEAQQTKKDIKEKKCTKCGQVKPIEEFYYRKKENRYYSICKECERKRLKEYSIKSKKERGY